MRISRLHSYDVLPRLALIGATFLWGANLTISKEVLHALTPLQLTAYRWIPAVLIIGSLALRLDGIRFPTSSSEWCRVGLSSIFGASGYSFFLYLALTELSPNQVAVLGALNPLMILLGSALAFRAQIRIREALGVLIAIAGVFVMFSGSGIFETSASTTSVLLGISMMLAALVSWTIFTLIGSRSTTPPLTSTMIQAVLTLIISSVILATFGELQFPDMTGSEWLSFLYVAVGATCIAFVLWLAGVKRIGAARSGPFLNLVPVFAIAVSTIVGYRLNRLEIVGATIVLIGTVLSTLRPRPKVSNDPPKATKSERADRAKPWPGGEIGGS